MSARILIVIGLLVSLATSAHSQQRDSLKQPVRTGRFLGIIKSSTTGAPVQTADIRLSYLDSIHVEKDKSGKESPEAFVDTVRSRIAVTDSAGSFTLRNVAAGHYMVNVRRIGFSPFEALITLDTATIEMELMMTQVAQLLPRVVVSTAAMTRVTEKLERSGFTSRARAAITGSFVDRSTILKQRPLRITDVLRARRIDQNTRFILDNIPVDWATLDEYPVDLIIGIEIYRLPGEVPVAFDMTRNVPTAFGNLNAKNAQVVGEVGLMQPTVVLWSYVP